MDIEKAKEILIKEGYIIIRRTKEMEKDAEECCVAQEEGKDKDCMSCSCNMCVEY